MTLRFWANEEQLAPLTAQYGFIPDGYFQTQRESTAGSSLAAFFVEVERSLKSRRQLQERFKRYGDFYYSGEYGRIFGTKALRVLFLVASEYGINPARQLETYSKMCEHIGATFFRFAALEQVKNLPGAEMLHAPIWRQPGATDPRPLFGPTSSETHHDYDS